MNAVHWAALNGSLKLLIRVNTCTQQTANVATAPYTFQEVRGGTIALRVSSSVHTAEWTSRHTLLHSSCPAVVILEGKGLRAHVGAVLAACRVEDMACQGAVEGYIIKEPRSIIPDWLPSNLQMHLG